MNRRDFTKSALALTAVRISPSHPEAGTWAEAIAERRQVGVVISLEVFPEVLEGNARIYYREPPPFPAHESPAEPRAWPKDAKVIRLVNEPLRDCLIAIYCHPSFEPVPAGWTIPVSMAWCLEAKK